MSEPFRLAILLLLVAGNAFFVIGEYAIVTARRSALTTRAEAGGRGAAAALRLMDDPVRVISTVQVGISAIGILIGAVGEPIISDLLGGAIPRWLAFLIAFAAITYLTVVFGELVPKAVTLDRAEALAAAVAAPIAVCSKLFRPAVWLLQGSAELVLRPFGIREVVAGDTIRSPEELRAIIDEAEGAGLIPRAQEEMLHAVFDFAGREAADVMVPAHQVVWLDAALAAGEALDVVLEQAHTRYPVCEGSLDRVVGVVHARDVAAAERADPAQPIGPLARTPPVVPETKDLGALLRELREARQQLAIVAGEYGETLGIVTLEDVLEEIVGEIEDEYDLPDATLERVGPATVRVSGTMTVDDFNETAGTELPLAPARTMAGLVFATLGRRPEPGDTVTFGAVRLTVEKVEGQRIARLLVEHR